MVRDGMKESDASSKKGEYLFTRDAVLLEQEPANTRTRKDPGAGKPLGVPLRTNTSYGNEAATDKNGSRQCTICTVLQ